MSEMFILFILWLQFTGLFVLAKQIIDLQSPAEQINDTEENNKRSIKINFKKMPG